MAGQAEQESEVRFRHRQLDDQKAAIWLANIIRPDWVGSMCCPPEEEAFDQEFCD